MKRILTSVSHVDAVTLLFLSFCKNSKKIDKKEETWLITYVSI